MTIYDLTIPFLIATTPWFWPVAGYILPGVARYHLTRGAHNASVLARALDGEQL